MQSLILIPTAIAQEISIRVNDEKVVFTDQKPFIDENDRIQIPIRAVVELMGAKITWNDIEKKILIEKDDAILIFQINSSIYSINDKKRVMDTQAKIIGNRTVFPIRFVVEALGASVKWNNTTKTVEIVYKSISDNTEEINTNKNDLNYSFDFDEYMNSLCNSTEILNDDDFINLITYNVLNFNKVIKLNFKNQIEARYYFDNFSNLSETAFERIEKDTGFFTLYEKWELTLSGNNLDIIFEYQIDKDKFQKTLNEARRIGEYANLNYRNNDDKIKFAHDYIANNAKYDTDFHPSSYSAYNIFFKQYGVCQAYAEAANIIFNQLGINSKIVTGQAYDSSSKKWVLHAWNYVEFDDGFYHIDITWNDPITSDGSDIIIYDYYKLNDSEISKTHKW